MHKKILRALVSIVLVLAICSVSCTNAFAASFGKKTYIKEFFISYGSSDDEAKKYLTDNGYEVVDNNLNEGADDLISKKRSVYLGYKTTDKSDEAITDMKLMNMKGGYSAQDYQILLNEQRESIQSFFEEFKVAVNEYRSNYKKNQERAIAAHDMLNMMYDDDTKQKVGDLLLNKVKEEYTDEEWNALSAEEQAKTADMTTILMQANANAVLSIEQIIALATDDNDNAWIERYQSAKTYDEMLQDVMSKNKVDASNAAKLLAAEYDDDAKEIASSFEDYKTYLSIYTDADIQLTNTQEEITAYINEHEDFDSTEWFAAGTQYEVLSLLENDDINLLDLITSDEFDPENDDRIYLYPLVSVLSKGQRACLSFLPMYQIIALGINDDNTVKTAMETIDLGSADSLQNISIYDGVDRSLFIDGNVAMTNEALRLQASSGQDPSTSAADAISTTSIVMYSVFAFSAIMTTISWSTSKPLTLLAERIGGNVFQNNVTIFADGKINLKLKMSEARKVGDMVKAGEYSDEIRSLNSKISFNRKVGYFLTDGFEKFWKYACIAMTCITVILLGLSAWSTYNDLKAYYNASFTPIPMRIIDETVNDKDEKVFTNYDAVKCNRVAANMVTDSNKLLGDFGDLNGDVGRQWVALYTTTDKAAGDPITTDFVVQYNNTNIPNDTVALSMFGESVAQNLTNKKLGYTYADGKSGIYLFYGTDTSIFAGSVFSNGVYALCGAGALVICAVAITLIVKASKKKKTSKEAEAHA